MSDGSRLYYVSEHSRSVINRAGLRPGLSGCRVGRDNLLSLMKNCERRLPTASMIEPASMVFVVDDNPSVRRAIKRLIGSLGLQVELFGSTQEFLSSNRPDMPSCLVLDIRLPGMNGLDFQRQLSEAGIPIPIIFITAHGDIPMSVRAMKAGAVEFLTKPFRDQDLLDAIHVALERDRLRRQRESELVALRERFASLSPREREVVGMVVLGMLNKQIASELGITENTVKAHRSRAMDKMQAQSLAELVKMAGILWIPERKFSSTKAG